MKVRFYATLRDIVGARTVEIPLEQGISAQVLFAEILGRYPLLHKELLDDSGRLYGHVHFFINGRDVQFTEQGWEGKIMPEDEIAIFPAVGGGANP